MPRMSRSEWIAQADCLTQPAETAARRYAAAATSLKEAMRKREAAVEVLRNAKQAARLSEAKLKSSRELVRRLRSWGLKGCLEFGGYYTNGDLPEQEEAAREASGAHERAMHALHSAEARYGRCRRDARAAQICLRDVGHGVDEALRSIQRFRQTLRIGVTQDSPTSFLVSQGEGGRGKQAADFVEEIGADHREFFTAMDYHLGVAAAHLIAEIQRIGRALGKDWHEPWTEFPQVPAAETVDIDASREPILPSRGNGLAVPFAKTLASLPPSEPPRGASPMCRPVGGSLFGRHEDRGERPTHTPNPLTTDVG